jgi:hypothetical protein
MIEGYKNNTLELNWHSKHAMDRGDLTDKQGMDTLINMYKPPAEDNFHNRRTA